MKELKLYISRFGFIGLMRFAIYPLTLLITSPFILIVSVFKSIRAFLLNSNLGKFKHFNLTPSLVSYFYSIRAWNLKKYGRTGQSDFLGLGKYYLARCFNYSKLSLNLYWKYGALTVFFGMFFWSLAFLIYPEKNIHFYLCLGLGLISSHFFANTFRSQNYNVVGWIFFPLVVIGLYEQNIALITIGIFLASFGSFTVVILSCIISGIYGLIEINFLMAFAGLPGFLKLCFHFYPFLKLDKNVSKEILSKVLKAIGANDKVLYKRKKTKALNLFKTYFIVLDIQFILACIFLCNDIPVLYIITVAIYLLNALKVRFADDQSINMLKLSMAIGTAIYLQDAWILPSLWLVISPIPIMAGYYQMKVLDVLPISEPLDMSVLESKFKDFFDRIPQKTQVLLSFENPDGQYEKVFAGMRNFIELPMYVAMESDIRLFPDWWAVFELNYEGSTEIWGTSENEILTNMDTWQCDYVICYSHELKPLNRDLLSSNNLSLESEFDWTEFDEMFAEYPKLKYNQLKWHLFKKGPKSN